MTTATMPVNGDQLAAEPAPPEIEKAIRIARLRRETMEVPIVGVSPLIPHRWSEKARAAMREKQTGSKARVKRESKDPAAEAEASLYRLEDGRPGMPAAAFAAATRAGARFYDGLTMVSLKVALFIDGVGEQQLVPITGEMKMREDTPRVGQGTADLRYRFSFWPWSAVLNITYVPTLIDAESVIALVDAGGNGGVGEWRPSSPKSLTGTFGRYEVVVGS
jgi:hypothetical protein